MSKSEIAEELKAHIDEVESLHHTKIAAVNDLVSSAYKAQQELEEPPRIIRTSEDLEALAREEPGAIVIAGEAGVARTARALCELRQLVYGWGLPAVVIATGKQVREAREAMEKYNG